LGGLPEQLNIFFRLGLIIRLSDDARHVLDELYPFGRVP